MDDTTWLDCFFNKRDQAAGRCVGYIAHSYASGFSSIFFSGNDHQNFGCSLPPANSLFETSNVSFVNFDGAGKPIPSGAHQRTPQFVQPRPRCVITTQSQNPLKSERACSVLLASDPPHSTKPQHQWFARVLEDGPGRYRCLIATRRALQQHRSQRPRLGSITARATETFWPPQSDQIIPARRLVTETCLELADIFGIVLQRPP